MSVIPSGARDLGVCLQCMKVRANTKILRSAKMTFSLGTNALDQSNSNTSCSTGLLHTGANDWRCSGVGPYFSNAARCWGVL